MNSIRDFNEMASIPLESLVDFMDQLHSDEYEPELVPTKPLIIDFTNTTPLMETSQDNLPNENVASDATYLLPPSNRFTRCLRNFGWLFSLLYVVISVLFLVAMHAGGLIFAPHFDPNWLWKLVHLPHASHARVLITWSILTCSIFNGSLLLLIGCLRHDQVARYVDNQMSLIAHEKAQYSRDRTLVRAEQWLEKIVKYNYFSFFLLFFACCFQILAGGFFHYREVHQFLYLLYLSAMVFYCAYWMEIMIVLSLRFNIEKHPGYFCLSFLLLFFITCFYLIWFPLGFLTGTEDTPIYLETLSGIAIDGIVLCIYSRMTNYAN